MQTGEPLVYLGTRQSDILTEEDIINNWQDVQHADRQELKSFIDHKVFACQAQNQMANGNLIDAVWVRRWKYDPKQGRKIIKSRLCGRGFLDKQKVGMVAAELRGFYPVEPYKAKGVKYTDEHVRRKEGKTVQ